MERDWDNLLIFDACRADMFEAVLGTDQFDSYDRIKSLGENSPNWIRRNFNGGTYDDTIYVVANPWTEVLDPGTFFEVVDVFANIDRYEDRLPEDHPDWEELGTVPASLVNDVAQDLHERYPEKRLVVHFFQPHNPVIGASDGSIDIDESLEPRFNLIDGDITTEDIWEGYSRNLRYVFHHARELISDINGKTAITADHGELLGEVLWPIPVRGYAHPNGVFHPNLVTVPWAVVEGERRTVTGGEVSRENLAADEERLRNLGYLS